MLGLVVATGLIAYVQQRGLTVASYRMMPELGLSQLQIGWLESATLLGYTLMQFPGGVLGQRLGARATFLLIGLLAFAATVLTPLSPEALGGTALFVALLGLQLLMGSAQGPIFPVASGVIEAWFPPSRWPLAQGLLSMGLGLGTAVTAPLVAWLMVSFGWQHALIWTTLPSLVVLGLWAFYGRNSPAEHPSVSAIELAELEAAEPDSDPPQPVTAITWRRMRILLADRDILALTFAYLCMNYVYYLLLNWCFLYLVQERHFSVLEGGWLAATPPLAAAVGAGTGGFLAGLLCSRYGTRWGLHLVPLASLPSVSLLLFFAVHASNAYLAVLGLALCFAGVELTEGSFWAATMQVARADTMAATGMLNTGGNLGGLVATPIVAFLSGRHEWTAAFVLGAAFALVSALTWLLVDPTRRLDGLEPERMASTAEALR